MTSEQEICKKYWLYNLDIPNFRVFLRNYKGYFWKFTNWEDIQTRFNIVERDTRYIKKARKELD